MEWFVTQQGGILPGSEIIVRMRLHVSMTKSKLKTMKYKFASVLPSPFVWENDLDESKSWLTFRDWNVTIDEVGFEDVVDITVHEYNEA